ncbi:hypothetical protein FI667_g5291, partial [Globisporangium splendens]
MRFALQERSSSDMEPSTRLQYPMGLDGSTHEAAADDLLHQRIQSSNAAFAATSTQRPRVHDHHRYGPMHWQSKKDAYVNVVMPEELMVLTVRIRYLICILRNSSRRRTLLGVLLSAVLVIAGVMLLEPPLERWQSEDVALRMHTQLARLENSIELLRTDTNKVVAQAKAFLKQNHRERIASIARTHLVATAAKRNYASHAKERFASHSSTMKQAIVYQSSQKLQINETHEWLRSMNISFPAPSKLKRTFTPTKQQQQQIQRQQKEFDGRIVGLVVDSAQEFVETRDAIESLRLLEQSIQAHKMRQSSKNSGVLFFYAFLVCLTGGYLWTAVIEKRSRRRSRHVQPWSPIPKFMIQIKDLLKSIVVIENFHYRKELLNDNLDAEDDLGSFMVRNFAASSKLATKRPVGARNTAK